MKKNKVKFYNRKRLRIGGAIATALSLTTTAVVLPTVYYGTADQLLYLDTFGNIQEPREPVAASPDHGNFKGEFDPAVPYLKDDVVSYANVVWHDDRVRKEFNTVTSTKLYKFTANFDGGPFNTAPLKEYDPFTNNYTFVSLPFDQLFADSLNPDDFMGHSEWDWKIFSCW